ncbi:hypothetical protein KL914_004309 [Ogataea haglerorum]|nr:hypothetical protein KL914_004309 [Ogataea haglerorum]KAG7806056.1 hypothetical protein KL924_004532 [Ogataea haglerorum]
MSNGYVSSRRKSLIPRRNVTPSGSLRQTSGGNSSRSMLPMPSSARVEPIPAEYRTPKEYIDILEAYVDQDLILEKQQTTQLIQKINVVMAQMQELTNEKNQIIREKRKIQSLISDLKANYENLDKTLVIKNKSIDNEVRHNKRILEVKKKELDETSREKVREVERQIHEMMQATLQDEEEDRVRAQELRKLEVQNTELEEELRRLQADNKRKLSDVVSEVDAEIREKNKRKEQDLSEPRRVVLELRSDLERANDELSKKEELLKQLDSTIEQHRSDIDSMKNYKGTLDEQMLELETQKNELVSKLKAVSARVELFIETDYTTAQAEYSVIQEKLNSERLTRLKIEDEIMEHQGKLRVMVEPQAQVPNELTGCVTDYVEDRVCVFVESALMGVSCVILLVHAQRDYFGIIQGHLEKRRNTQRYENWQIEISEVTASHVAQRELKVTSCNANTKKRLAASVICAAVDGGSISAQTRDLCASRKTMVIWGHTDVDETSAAAWQVLGTLQRARRDATQK